ncbi:uncharacterized protein LOC143852704 isoform X3 [Tasmannia lanceolata]|uniref:uncharacterized protein LOC143852704 isoform X3 n=1 Tax=Tasmannia lanceolata TaxID=3420 RepID=UPI004063011E
MLKSFTSSAIQLGMTFIGENITNLPEDNLPFLERIRENSIGPSEDFGVYSKMHCWRAPKFPNRKITQELNRKSTSNSNSINRN